jgi:tetratricopeptide (TPR) repeat protein
MAPEQTAGMATDARTDQYAFCVTAWEALFCVRPAARDAEPHVPAGTAVPTWVQRVLLRGLSRNPESRFADMPELIAALVDDPTRRRRRWAVGVAGIAAVTMALGGTAWTRARAHDECRALGSEIDEVWNDAARDRVRTAMLAPQLGYGADTWTRVEPELDAYAARWSELRASNCSAQLTGQRTSELSARGEECFAEHRIELSATLAALVGADPSTVLDAVTSVLALPDVERCGDEAWLARRRPTVGDPALRRELDGLRGELARANRMPESQSADAVAVAESVLARAVELDSIAMRLEAERALALASGKGGDFARSAEASRRAFALAIESGDDDVATAIAASLLFTEGYLLGRYEQADTWAELGAALVARNDPEGGLPTAQLANSRGAMARAQGRYDDARRDFAEASSIRERVLGLDHPLTLESVANAGVVQMDTGDLAGAEATFRTVVEARARLQGPAHPEVAQTMSRHAAALASLGRSAEAVAMLQRALVIEERALGPTSPRLWATLHNLGLLQTRLGDAPGARATHERELAVVEGVPGAEPGRVGKTLVALAMAELALDDPGRAMTSLVRARALIESAVGPHHPELAMCLEEIAAVHERLGELEDAAESYRRALEIRTASQEPFHPDAALVRSYLGDIQLDLGDTEAALATLQTSMFEMLASVGPEHHNTALTLASLGRLHHRRGEHATALELLRSATVIEERMQAPDRDVARAHHHVGRVLLDMGELDAALREHETAVTLAEGEGVGDPFTIAVLQVGLAEAEAAGDRLADAEGHARSALARLQEAHVDPVAVAEARLVLGEILRARGDASEARVHLDRACEVDRPPYALRLRRCPPGIRTAG